MDTLGIFSLLETKKMEILQTGVKVTFSTGKKAAVGGTLLTVKDH